MTVWNPEPGISLLSPNAVNIGTFTVKITGRGFVPTSKVLLGGVAVASTYVTETELTFQTTDNNARDTQIVVANPDPGASSSNAKSFRIMPPVSVNVSPDQTTARIGTTRQFYVSVSNAVDRSVTWYVNNVKGGNANVGTISETGLYTPPATLPSVTASSTLTTTLDTIGPQISVRAASNQDSTKSDTSVLILQNAIPVLTTATPASMKIGEDVQVTVNGTGFAPGAVLLLGSSEMRVLSATPTRILATGKAKASVGGITTLQLRNPDPGASSSNALVIPVGPGRQLIPAQAAARFLQRSTWGPSPESIAHLQEVGIDQFLNEQFNAPQSAYPDALLATTSASPAQKQFYSNAMLGQDQLRQRVAFALSQILVVSGVKTGSSAQLVPYMRLLHESAFGNYFTLLKAVTLNPTMGRFLDMVNNAKANPTRGTEPNENYARELLQLLTIGIDELDLNGIPKLDAFGQKIPTYSEATVKELSKALTGWTFAPRPGETPRANNPSNYAAPMVAWEPNHDQTQKTLLRGQIIPAGRTAEEDVDAVIANIAQHPNVAPFISLRLIQRLVMGNPSPAYIQRVAQVFQSTRGDLKATVRAILLDPEADLPAPNQGKLREPVLLVLSFLRGLDARVDIDHSLNSYASQMGQNLWFAPSVFNYFSPFFRMNGQVAPEFQINTPSVALNRANFIYRAGRNGIGSAVGIDLAHFERLAADPAQLIEALNQALMSGGMSAEMKASILTALNATTDARVRARNAIYLVGTSSQFQVEP